MSLARLKLMGNEACVVPQNLTELWAVATRPEEARGLAMSHGDVRDEIRRIRSTQTLLCGDERDVFDRWLKLVTGLHVTGKVTHDARIAAAAMHHGVTHILSFDTRFDGLGLDRLDPMKFAT